MSEHPHNKRKLFLSLLALIVIIVAVIFTLYWVLVARFYQSTQDAYVAGNQIPVAARISGSVTHIRADDNDLVIGGNGIIWLDDSDTQQALSHAKANLKHTLQQTKALYASVSRLKSIWQQAQRDYQRAKQLKASNSISDREYQHAQAELESSRASYDEVLARTANSDIKDHPQVKLAIAELKKAWLAQQRTAIKAPISGYVAQRHVQVGQTVQPGEPLLAVVPLDHLWIDANFKETKIANLRIGQPVKVTADVYGSDHVYHGEVAGISAGSGNAFSLLPPQNATGNWIKIVQRIPVRIALDPEELAEHPLRIGMSTTVEVDTHNRKGEVLAQLPPSDHRFTTDIYQVNEQQFQQLVNDIIEQVLD